MQPSAMILPNFSSIQEMAMNTLVVYFSRTGNTKGVAEAIATELGADIEQIEESAKRTGFFGYLQSVRESVFKKAAPIQAINSDLSHYNLIIIGSPVWCWSLTSPVRSFLVDHSSDFKSVAFFCTEGGKGGQGVFEEMAKLCGKTPQSTLEVTESDIRNGEDKLKLKTFVQTLSQRTAREKPVVAQIVH